MSAVGLLDGSAGCAKAVLPLMPAKEVDADFFPRPLPDLSDSRRGLLTAASAPPPVAGALLSAAGYTQQHIAIKVHIVLSKQKFPDSFLTFPVNHTTVP